MGLGAIALVVGLAFGASRMSSGGTKARWWIGSIAAVGGKSPFSGVGDVKTMLIADPKIPGEFDGYDLDGTSMKLKYAPAAWADVKFLGVVTLQHAAGQLPAGVKAGKGRIVAIKTYELTSEKSPAGKPKVGDTVYFD